MSSSIKPENYPWPSGTVTFLFTEIEGSTSLAQDYPEDINTLLQRHNAILQQSIQAHNGFIFRINGDAFCAAFRTASEAVGAALEAQRKLHVEDWHPAPVKVRMGIHTGTAQSEVRSELGDDYVGYLTLTRVQRVMSAAHGGQVLLSSASAELVRGSLPEQGVLSDMGEHLLKGLANPERIWQLVVPGLPVDFPPLHTSKAFPNNLPAQSTSLVGREKELADILDRLGSSEVRLLTLTGPGGIGKTRTALQAGADLIGRFKDGVFLIDLAPIRNPTSFPTAIAQTLGMRENVERPAFSELKEQLRAKMMLLILDNFEQVTAAASMVGELLRECPHLKLLVTSREALRVRGENIYPIPPLALPSIDRVGPTIEQITQYEAVRLFIERAQAVKPDFTVTNENAPAVAEICWRLDGLPLAIELAAARLRLFPPQALLERLGNRLKILKGGASDLPARQQTLRDTIEWGYELLDSEEQRLFELLSVFTGGCTFEAVESAARMVEPVNQSGTDILEGLASLVDKSMLRLVEQDNGEARVHMLETIREFAAERLAANPAFCAAVQRSHAEFFADFAQRQWEQLSGNEREAALLEMGAELENLRVAWRYWVQQKDLLSLGKCVDSLWLFYDVRGRYNATLELTTDLLEVLSSTPSTPELAQQELVLRTSLARAMLATKGYTSEVEEAYTRALELSQTAGDLHQSFPVLRGLYSFYTFRGEFDKVLPLGEQIMDLAERYNDPDLRIEGHFVLGSYFAFTGNTAAGLEHWEKGISLIDPHRQRSNRFRLGNYTGVSSYVASSLILWGIGYPDRSLQYAQAALELAKEIDHPYSQAYALYHIGFLHYWRHENETSLSYAQELLDIAEKYQFQIWHAVGTCLQGIGIALLGRAEEGLSLLREGMELYQGLKSPPIFLPLLRSLQIQAYGLAGKVQLGLNLLDEVFGMPSAGYGSVLMIDLLILKGDLLQAHSPGNNTEAEQWYLQAQQSARDLGAITLELRSAIKLARLWLNQEGQQLLREAVEKFSEGFATPEMLEARQLLGET